MPLFAERVDEKTAQKVAETFLKNGGAKATCLKDLTEKAGFRNLYVFSADKGFVVMAADNCVQPILGYSKTGTFSVEEMPDNIRFWLQGYSDQIQAAIDRKAVPSSDVLAQWKGLANGNAGAVKSDIVVDALIQTTWDQGAPYNNLCPLALNGNGQYEHCVTGCVATAMAQVIKFWNHPAVGLSWNSYYPNNGNPTYYGTVLGLQEVYFYNTHYDWNHMPNAPTTSSPAVEQNAVATLMYHCGVAVNMMYDISSVGGSGAYSNDVPNALKNYFNFSNSVNGKYRVYYTDDEWKTLLKNELDSNRPIYYSGSGTGGGHAFVCDGYDSDDLFHFNWGWGSHCDGFYAINNIAPGTGGIGSGSTGDFNNSNYAIFGIEPNFSSANPPTNLVGSLTDRSVSLTWTAANGAAAYNVYRNNMLVASNVTGTSCTDNLMPYGTNRYYVRSVDSEGNLSESSNVVEFTLIFSAPTNLTAANNNDESITLSWDDESELAISYNIYCNDEIIGASNTTSFLHSMVPFGEVYYYVRGVDSYGDESLQSNVATLTHSFGGPSVTDLTANLNGSSVNLSWTEPESESGTLQYGVLQNSYVAVGYNGDTYWAEVFPATQLVSFAGMAITSVKNFFHSAGNYELNIYSTASTEPLFGVSFNIPNKGYYTIPISSAVPLDFSHDMWIVFHAYSGVQHPAVFITNYSGDCTNAAYLSSNGSSWSQYLYEGDEVSWVFQISVTDGTYTYNLYDGETKLNGTTPITGNSYTVSSVADNAAHCYTLKTNYYGGESNPSNMVGYALGEASLPSLSLGGNDKMTVKQNARLSVTGVLENSVSDNLIIENGAQLSFSGNNVQATVEKDIEPYHNDEDGWNFIASPVTGGMAPSVDNGLLTETYDLFYYSEPEHYWKNYKQQSFDLNHGMGYLYANGETDGTTIRFAGTLQPSDAPFTVDDLSHESTLLNGFNLVGNPFACNANIGSLNFYVCNGSSIELAENGTIPPCAGIMVKATDETESVTFTSGEYQSRNSMMDVTVAPSNAKAAVADRVRVSFDKTCNLDKFSFGKSDGELYFRNNEKNYAVSGFEGQDEMSLCFKAAKNGSYTLTFDLKNVDLAYLHLIDNLTGADVDILAASEGYTFDAKTSDYPSRFKLVFAEKNQPNESDDSNFMYYADGQLFVFGGEENGTVQIVDVTGRVVLNEDVNGFSSKSVSLKPGVYVAHMICGEVVKSQKFVAE